MKSKIEEKIILLMDLPISKRLSKIGMLYTPIHFKIYAFKVLYLWKRKCMDRDE